MIDRDTFKHIDAGQNCSLFAYTVNGLVYTARLALENETSVGTPEQKQGAIATALEVVEAMMAVVIDGSEDMERELERGVYRPKVKAV